MKTVLKKILKAGVRVLAAVPVLGRLIHLAAALYRMPERLTKVEGLLLQVNHVACSELPAELSEVSSHAGLLLEINHLARVELPSRIGAISDKVSSIETLLLDVNHLARVDLPGRVEAGMVSRDQVATLLATVSDLNRRFANLEISVPVSLRNMVRQAHSFEQDIQGLKANGQQVHSLEEAVHDLKLADGQQVHSLEEAVHDLKLADEQQIQSLEQAIHGLKLAAELQIQSLHQVIGDLRQKDGRRDADADAFRSTLNSYSWMQDATKNLSDSVGYLLNRVEFVRRELMFEIRYGAGASNVGGLDSTSEIVNQDKVDSARLQGNVRVNVGCGHVALDGFLNIDRRKLPGVDIVAEADALPFEKGELAEVFSAHMLEHFPQEQLRRSVLPHYYDLLKPGGQIRAVVPDAEGMVNAYKSGEYSFERLREVTFGAQDYDGDFHYNMISPDSMSKLLAEAGFCDIRVLANNRENGGCKEFEIVAFRF